MAVTPSTALVGPLPTISFWGGRHWRDEPARVAYEPPKHTGTLRARLCNDHHPACDCREAEFAEEAGEWRAQWQAVRAAFQEVLAGHNTWAYDKDGERDRFAECRCTGCDIARRTDGAVRPYYEVRFEHREARQAAQRGDDLQFHPNRRNPRGKS